MAKNKITQKKGAFYILWQARKENKEQYVPAWRFVGEFYCKELGEWFFMSYKGPTNGLAIYFDNPGLVERREVRGRTGAKYFEYRFTQHATFEMIKEPDIKAFAQAIERRYQAEKTQHDGKI